MTSARPMHLDGASIADEINKVAAGIQPDPATALNEVSFTLDSGVAYTIEQSDLNKTIVAAHASAQSIVAPVATGWTPGSTVRVVQVGGGALTFTAAGGVSISNLENHLTTLGENSVVYLMVVNANNWSAWGDFASS